MVDAPSPGRRDPDALRSRAGVRGDSRRDQHFLVDNRVLDRIPGYAEDFDVSHVLEIGAGTGGLTDRLLAIAEQVTAIERDRELATFLESEFAAEIEGGRLDVIAADAVSTALPGFTTCVSNLPYGASSEILFRLLSRKRPLVLMVQREFAERMAAHEATPEYGRLSVTAQHFAAIEIMETVPPAAFEPQPAVESAVIRTTPRDPEYSVPSEEFFLDFVTAVFTQRRKTMRNAIRNTTHISGITAPEAVVEAADPAVMEARPERLSPADFAALAILADRRGKSE